MASATTTTTPPTPAPFWPAIRPYLVKAALLVAGGVAAILAERGFIPREAVEVIREVPAALPEALRDLSPIDYEGARYDGGDTDHHAHPLAAPEPARWPVDRITYSVDYASARGLNPPLSDAAVQAAFKQAANWWGEQLALDFVEVPAGSSAMIPINFARIDGPQGVLAQAYLADGTTRPKPLTMDSSERWTAGAPASGLVSIPTVACHELGHSLGLDHDAANAPAVMRPTYSAAVPREQERDIQRMVQLGYVRRAKVPPAPTDVLAIPVQVKTEDLVNALRNAGYTVTR